MFDYDELKEIIDNIEDKKDRWNVHFTAKHPVAWIYGKIG